MSVLPLTLAALLIASPAIAQTSDEAQVKAVDAAWVKAEVTHNAAALSAVLDDQFIATFDAGTPVSKAPYIFIFTDGPADPANRQVISDQTLRIVGDTAVVVETDTVSGMKKGVPYSFKGRLTATFVKHDGQWKALALHFATVRP